jgi:predicted CoA-binding protein
MTSYRLSRSLDASSDPETPSPERMRSILEGTRTIAVVGLSRDPTKAARRVPSYLAAKGFDVIPVNPHATRILGKPARASLDDVLEPVDMVIVFRPSDEAGGVIRQAAARPERPVIWLQEGLRNDEAANEARVMGLTVIQDLCIYKVHRTLAGPLAAMR